MGSPGDADSHSMWTEAVSCLMPMTCFLSSRQPKRNEGFLHGAMSLVYGDICISSSPRIRVSNGDTPEAAAPDNVRTFIVRHIGVTHRVVGIGVAVGPAIRCGEDDAGSLHLLERSMPSSRISALAM